MYCATALTALVDISSWPGDLLSTCADKQGVDISFTFVCVYVCVCVCTITDFLAKDKTSSIKFCNGSSSASKVENLPFWGSLLIQKPKIGWIGHPPGSEFQGGKTYRNRVPIKFALCVDVGSAVAEDEHTCVFFKATNYTANFRWISRFINIDVNVVAGWRLLTK